MLEANILEDCLFELPPIGRLARWRFRSVDSPVRSVVAVSGVYPGGLEGPVAGIYRAEFIDGTTREIVVEGDPLHRDFNAAYFLKDGRKNSRLGHVLKLIIRDPEDAVPESLKDALRQYQADRRYQTVDAPVRSVVAVASVLEGRGLMDGPVAGIYRAEFMDGVTREIFVEGDPLERDFGSAVFLRPGRKSTQLDQVLKLIIPGPEGIVPDSLKDALRQYEADRDQAALRLNCG